MLVVALVELVEAGRYDSAIALGHEIISGADGTHIEPMHPERPLTDAERAKLYRARKRHGNRHASVTPSVTIVTETVTTAVTRDASLSSSDLNAEKDADKQGIQQPEPLQLTSENAGATVTSRGSVTEEIAPTVTTAVTRVLPARRKTDKKPAPIPAGWAPTAEHRAFAANHGLDLEREAYGFRGFFEGQAVLSPNGRFATWLSNSASRKDERRALLPAPKPPTTPKSHRYLP